MKTRIAPGRSVAVYEAAAGGALVVAAVATRSWWTLLCGTVVLGMGAMGLVGRSENTSWLRGDIDERRRHAVDHGFRVAFVVLAWWVAAMTAAAMLRSLPDTAFAAGILIALIAAFVDYALVLRRS